MHLGAPHSTYGSSVLNLPPPQSNYGFGGGREEPNPFGDYVEQVNQPWGSRDVSDETLRNLMGFVPVAGTMYNWDQMQPWERGLSMGLDAIDIATLGGGKPITAAARAGIQGFRKFAKTPIPTYMRFGDIVTEDGKYLPSFNYGITNTSEKGVSTYPAMYDPGVNKYVIQSSPNVSYKYRHPSGARAANQSVQEYMSKPPVLDNKPLRTQHKMVDTMRFADSETEDVVRQFPRTVEGDLVPRQVGSDFEPLMDPKSIRSTTRVHPSKVVMSEDPSQILTEHGRLIPIPGSTRQIPDVKFNLDEYGKHIPTTGDKILELLGSFNELMRDFTSSSGFSLAQLGTLATRGEINAP